MAVFAAVVLTTRVRQIRLDGCDLCLHAGLCGLEPLLLPWGGADCGSPVPPRVLLCRRSQIIIELLRDQREVLPLSS